jgi:uncharacterized protein YbaR (Trm112 family)
MSSGSSASHQAAGYLDIDEAAKEVGRYAGQMPLSRELHQALLCPESRQPLLYIADEDVLYCPASRLKFAIRNGIPVMLIEEAKRVEDDQEAERLVAHGVTP